MKDSLSFVYIIYQDEHAFNDDGFTTNLIKVCLYEQTAKELVKEYNLSKMSSSVYYYVAEKLITD
jgi:hypothetical protein